MAAVAASGSWDALVSTTLKNYTPKIEDNLFTNVTLLYWLKEAGHIEKVNGGEQLVEPLLYEANDTVGAYAGYDNILTTPQDGITSAIYDWKQYAVSVAISGLEEAKNRGESAVVSLLKAKIDQAEMSLMDGMNKMFYGTIGTQDPNKVWNGLPSLIEAAAKGSQTLSPGGIASSNLDASGNRWWVNQFKSIASDVSSTTDELGQFKIADLSSIYNACSNGRIHPDFILTSQQMWERYESLLQPQLRYQSTKAADAGFENLLYKSAPIMWDAPLSNTGTNSKMYFLNSKFLKLKVHSDVWLKNTPFEKPHGQDARYSQILCYGNLVTNNRRYLGVLNQIDAVNPKA
jgi:hypothetical protein